MSLTKLPFSHFSPETRQQILSTLKSLKEELENQKSTKTYPIFLTGSIHYKADWYEPLMKLLTILHEESIYKNEDPVIELHVNSTGGDATIAIQIINAINRCQVPVHLVVSGYCQSAAALIAIGGNYASRVIDPLTSFLFHDGSSETGGKISDKLAIIQQERKWIRAVCQKYYASILTMEEIDTILEGKELFMMGEEVIERLENHQLTEEDVNKIVRITSNTSSHKPLFWKDTEKE